jgi:signal recognition particle receptor subunit beta
MAVFDVARKTITLKIVYYGCALGGKTTNLVTLHRLTDPDSRQGLVSIATNDDRTLFFDLLPMDLGRIAGMSVKVKLYTVPGQVHYETTRRQVVSGADGVVFVADSSPEAIKSNAWAFKNLRYNLKENGLDPDTTPIVLQWNKRDLPNARSVRELEVDLGQSGLPAHEAVATTGLGVVETFASILKHSLRAVYRKHGKGAANDAVIDSTVDKALSDARAPEPAAPGAASHELDHRFNMDAYRESEAERGRDRRVVDQESLLSESVNANMILAEKLDALGEEKAKSDRRGSMMAALAKVAPMLSDASAEALPRGAVSLLLAGADRDRGSLLLFRSGQSVMDERESVPEGRDPLNAFVSEGIGSVAYRLAEEKRLRIIDDLMGQVFYGTPPPGGEDIVSLLMSPVQCDGLDFGCLVVYGGFREPDFDNAEREYWVTASMLIGLSLHWHALRRKLIQSAGA